LGSTWGQAQALVTQALMESEMGESTAHLLQRVTQLAHNNAFTRETQLIASQNFAQKENHVLLFIQAV
jgi:hypothetical protein